MKHLHVKVIAFDADDTLWVNEPLFQNIEKTFCLMLEDYLPSHTISREFLKVEINNLADYGYGVKSYILSMIEAAIRISNGTIATSAIQKIISLGKELINAPIELIHGVENVLETLGKKYKLVIATKGDLLDQERKLTKSGLEKYFHHIEIVSEKNETEYLKLIRHLDIKPHEFAMIGNSLKSDILPVLNIGAIAIHIPYHTTWELEKIEKNINHPNFIELTTISDVINYF